MADRIDDRVAPALTGTAGRSGATAITGRFRRRYSLLTGRDKLVLGLMVGIPLILDIIFIWGPTFVSVLISFTNWNGIGSPFDAEVIGLRNYESSCRSRRRRTRRLAPSCSDSPFRTKR